MKYKVGDRVRIKSLDWYNENKDRNGNVRCGEWNFTKWYTPYCGAILTIRFIWEDDECYKMIDSDYHWTDEMIECKVEEETKPIDFTIKATDTKGKVEVVIPDGYSYVIENDKLYFVTEKKEVTYPKTYEECCKIFGLNHYLGLSWNSYDEYSGVITGLPKRIDDIAKKLESLSKLIICRDAYWKIAGEEMGLGKPWKPDWDDEKQDKYGFHSEVKYTIINSATFVFPTAKMRDAFKENFDPDIEICKELL